IIENFQREAANLSDRSRTVGGPRSIAHVDDRFPGQLIANRTCHGESANAGIEYSYRRISRYGSLLHSTSLPRESWAESGAIGFLIQVLRWRSVNPNASI